MSEPTSAIATPWHIIEAGDRWYQALLRFTQATATRSSAASRRDSQAAAIRPLNLIRRWDPAAAPGLITWAGQHQAEQIVLLWELPAEPKIFVWMLEAMATIRRHNHSALQLAHVPPRRSIAIQLAVQEAGADFLLHDLWSLEKVVQRLSV